MLKSCQNLDLNSSAVASGEFLFILRTAALYACQKRNVILSFYILQLFHNIILMASFHSLSLSSNTFSSLLGHTGSASAQGLLLTAVRNHSPVGSGNHMGYKILNQAWPHASQCKSNVLPPAIFFFLPD